MKLATPITNILPTVRQFGQRVLRKGEDITNKEFADEFGKIERQYLREYKDDLFCEESDMLVDKLIAENKLDFAGIVLSTLCKMNEFVPEALEYFAWKGYDLSKRTGDSVHMVARLNNLRKVYDGQEDRLFDYIYVLYKQEKGLRKLTKHYDDTVAGFRTVSKEVASKASYEDMLAHIQVEIAKLTRRKHPLDARRKLTAALNYFEKQKNHKSATYAKQLISEIDTVLGLNTLYG